MNSRSRLATELRRTVLGTLVLILLAGSAVQSVAAVRTSSLNIQSSPNPAQTTDLITISGQLTGDGQPLSKQTVNVEYSTDGNTWNLIASLATGSDGEFSTSWKPISPGQFYLRATFGDARAMSPKRYAPSSSSVIVQQVNSSTPPAPSGHIGVNYLTLYHRYDTPTETLQRDFARFKNDGITTIVVAMFWYRLESSKGVYNQKFVNNVIRICNVATQYGLEVMIDFHTLIQESDTWSNPAYVGIGMNLITNATIASSYVAMVRWTVDQLKGVPNIWSYAVLNEPWYWPLDDWRKTNWINLMVELSGVVKQTTGKSVTVRFVGALFERDWGWDSRIINALDFISLNAYINGGSSRAIDWKTPDEYSNGLRNIAQKAGGLGKQVQITEFGSASDDSAQADRYRTYTDIFKGTQNVIGWLSWGWDVSYDPNNPTWDACGTYSIVVQSTGTPRPAYLVLIQNR